MLIRDYIQRFIAITAFSPPNANEFDSAHSTWAARA
jgi:hypothetical protein